jgi:hypothetical protein
MLLTQRRGEMFDRFADDLKLADHGILHLRRGEKRVATTGGVAFWMRRSASRMCCR